MIKLSTIKEKCFGELADGCTVVKDEYIECGHQCPFYKPIGCEDWIRKEIEGEAWIVPPEEYYEKV